ncbi:MAG: CopD family protein [Parvularculaceae bacterium]
MRDFLLSIYPWIKALHLAAVVAFMAGMMYLPRLFVYHHQSEKGGEAERYFTLMERRLLMGIVSPALIAIWLLAGLMLYANPAIIREPWFLAKLPVVVALAGVHGFYATAVRKFGTGERPRSERFWRIMNEVPFLMMLAAIFLAVVKPG